MRFWRARITIGGLRENILYTLTKRTEGELDEVLDGIKPVLAHAVSVKKQYTDDLAGPWRTQSATGLVGDS